MPGLFFMPECPMLDFAAKRRDVAADAPRHEGFAMTDDDYVYDDATGEWVPRSALAATPTTPVVRDASGTPLADGDAVVLIKDLKVKGAGQTLKQGTVIRAIRLTDNPDEIDCRHDSIKGLVLRTEFVRRR